MPLRPAFSRPGRARPDGARRWFIRVCARVRASYVAALHAGAPEPAARLLEQVRAEIDPATAFVGSFSPVMVVHTGPGLVGLAWWWDERELS